MGFFSRTDKSESQKNFSDRDRKRELYKAVCSNCGKDCEVPFKPTGDKPVYCSECFHKIKGGDNSKRFRDKSPRRPDFDRRNESRPQSTEQVETINRKLDKILELLATPPVKAKKETKVKSEEIKIKPKSPKKKTSVAKK